MAIPEQEIEKIKQSISLADVIRSRGVELKKKGRQLWGLCPFHSEDEPSFAVDERKGLWNCLGKCQTGGDVFSFVMKSDGINFKEAFALLSENLPSNSETGKEKPLEKETADAGEMTRIELEYLEKAAVYYHKTLLKNEKAIEYLRNRGISAEAIRVFRLGFVDGTLKNKISA
jgi:DNA primase